jgi:phosphoglycerol transferase
LDQLATLNIFALLLATVGGFSSLIALFVSGQIRAYNRISVYIGFFALFAVVLCLDRWYRRAAVSSPARRGAFLAGLGVLLGVGLFDQSARSFTPHYAGVRARYAADAAFVARIEASAGPNGKVFQLPYEPFPEPDPQVGNMGKYDHLRGYLHSKTLRWSYGSVKGRPADLWQRRLAGKPVPEMVRDLRAAGFAGIWVDRSGLTDGGAALERDLRRLLGTPPTVESRETHRVYYALSAPAGPAAASQQDDVGQ